jgi:hypothetical protein
MRYLIIPEGSDPFFTNWFSPLNNFVAGMLVIDTHTDMFTRDGITWQEIEHDHL